MVDRPITRGRLLGLGALTAAGLTLRTQAARGAVAMPATGPWRIDVHGHAITPTIEAALAARGSRRFEGRELPVWTLEATLEHLGRQGLDLQVLSTPDPALSLIPDEHEVAAARAINDELAGIVAEAEGRLGALAVLPLRAGRGAAIAELRRTRRLGFDGVILPTTAAGRALGDPAWLPLLSELSRYRTPALVHPVAPAGDGNASPEQDAQAAALEAAFGAVRCAASLLYSGAFLRAPHLRLIFAGGGGGLPFVASRVALVDQALHGEVFIRPLRQLAFDTAGSTAPGALDSMRAFVRGPTQLLYGSDWPLAPERAVDDALARLAPGERPIVGGQAALGRLPTLARHLPVRP